jgi:hypothetical protein
MTIKTYSELLIEMSDALDAYIAPKKVRREDTNFIYMVMKAIAKGYEIIHNTVVILQGKFDPELCDDRDLLSIAKIAGTEMLAGTGTGLVVIATNESTLESATLFAGDYEYPFDDATSFFFTRVSDTVLAPLEQAYSAAFTAVKGSYPVSAINNLPVIRIDEAEIPGGIVFSCLDNVDQLGSLDESPVEFRKRILTDTGRQDTISEIEIRIKNLPYLFDCKLLFNSTDSSIVLDGITVPSFHLLMLLNGDPRDEIAQIISDRTIFPTVQVVPTDVLYVYSDVFLGGKHPIYFTPFAYKEYNLTLDYTYNDRLMSEASILNAVTAALLTFKNTTKHQSLITEDIFYNVIKGLNIASFTLLDVTLLEGASVVPYVSVPVTRIPRLVTVTLNGTAI